MFTVTVSVVSIAKGMSPDASCVSAPRRTALYDCGTVWKHGTFHADEKLSYYFAS